MDWKPLGLGALSWRLKDHALDITNVFGEVLTDWTPLCHVLKAYLTSHSPPNLLSR